MSKFYFLVLILLFFGGFTKGQAPNISYPGPQQYFLNTAIPALAPTNSGGAIPAAGYGTSTTFATGVGTYENGAPGGPGGGVSALAGMTMDKFGNLFLCDQTHFQIKKITPSGVVTVLAGSGVRGSANGVGTAASFDLPGGIAVDGSGNLYVVNYGTNVIRKITAAGVVTTFAGSGAQGNQDGVGTAASFDYPSGLACDANGNVYVADYFANEIRKITPDGVVSRFQVNTPYGFVFSEPTGVAVGPDGNLYVTEGGIVGHLLKITPDGTSTILGTGGIGYGTVNGLSYATFDSPQAVAVDAQGNIYITEGGYYVGVKKMSPLGYVTVLNEFMYGYNSPLGVAVNSAENVFVKYYGSVSKVISTGYTCYSLPRGLTLNNATGVISGTPVLVPTAATDYTIIAYNSSGSSTTTVNLAVGYGPPSTPVISGSDTVIIGNNYTYTASPAAGVTGYTWTLPDNTTVSGSSNTITFTGSITGALSVVASNSSGTSTAATLNITAIQGQSQVIAMPAFSSESFGAGDIILPSTTDAGLPITYTSSDSTVAIIDSSIVTSGAANKGGFQHPLSSTINIKYFIHVVGTGQTTIKAKQAGNNVYTSTSATRTLTVNPANQTISFGALAAVNTNTADFSPAAIATSGLPVSYNSSDTTIAQIINGFIHLVGAGTVNIIASQPGNADYKPASNVIQPLQVNKTAQIISFQTSNSITFGTPDYFLSATSNNSTMPITYQSSDTTIATIVNGRVHIISGGSVTITALQAGNGNYIAATPVKQLLTILPAAQYIAFPTIASQPFNPVDLTLGASSTSALPITYASTDTTIIKIVNGKLHMVGTGTVTITANQKGNVDFGAAMSVSQTFTITKATQTITFNPVMATYGDPDVAPGAVATSGLPITYTISDTTVAKLVNGKFHILKAGAANITAAQPGNADYLAAKSVLAKLTINKGPQTITFNALPVPAYGSTFTPSATSTSGLAVTFASSDTTIAKASGTGFLVKGVGTATITASQAGGANYLPATPVTQTLTTGKGSQTITFAALAAKTYGSADFTISATSSSRLGLTFTSSDNNIATVSGNTVHIVGTGTVNITANQAGSSLYLAAPPVVQSLTINPASQTITFLALAAKTYGAADFAFTATATSKLGITFVSSDTTIAKVTGSTVHIVSTGTVNITASQAGNSLYLAAAPVVQPLTINKAAQTIVFTTPGTKTYGTANFAPVATVASGLPITFASSNTAVATIVSGNIHIVGVGTATITASQAGSNLYLAATPVSQTLTVKAAALTITANSLSKIYGAANPTLTVIYSGFVNGETSAVLTSPVLISTTATTTSAAGNYAIKDSAAVAANYTITYVAGTLTIGKASQTITFNTLPVPAYGSTFTPIATSTSGLAVTFASSDTTIAKASGTGFLVKGVGTASITASQAGGTNYLPATPVTQTLTTGKSSQTITFAALAAKTWGAADFVITATASSKLGVTFASSDTTIAKVTGSTVHIVSTGTVNITASQAGSSLYLAAPPVVQSLTINKASQTITFLTLAAKTYGAADFAITATSTSKLGVTFVSSDTTIAKITGSTVHIVSTGIVNITASQPGSSLFLAATPVVESLTINKAAQTIVFTTPGTKTYGAPNFAPVTTVASGLPLSFSSSNTAVATIVNGNIHIVGVGTATITASQVGSILYLAATPVPQTLTVKAAALTITANNLSKIYGAANPTLTVTYAGFVNGETSAVLTSPALISTTATATSAAGNYAIKDSAAVAANYTITYVPGTLTIGKASQTITFNTLPVPAYGSTFTPSATSTSGLVVTFASSDTTIAKASGTGFLVKGVGIATITASQAGGTNYLPATPITQTLTTGKSSQTITFAALAAKTWGNPDFVISATASSKLGVTFASSDTTIAKVTGSTVHIVSTGTVNITASQAGSPLYLAATPVVQSLTINKASQTITFLALAAKTYGAADFAITATSTSKLGVTFVSSDTTIAKITGSTVHIISTGTVNITASQAGSLLYLAATPVMESLTINKAPQTIVFTSPGIKIYGTPDFAPAATIASGLPISFASSNTAVATIINGNIHIVGLGTDTIRASQPGNGNYLPATTVAQVLTVRAAPVVVTANNQSKVAGTANPVLTVSYSGFVNGETSSVLTTQPTIKTTAITTSAAGSYPITASGATASDYTFTYVAGTLTVSAPSLAFGAIAPQVYGNADFNPGATSNLPVTYTSSNPAVATVVSGNIHIIGVGVSTITVTNGRTSLTQQLTVTPASLTVTATNQTKVYGAAVPVLSVSYSGFVNGDTQSVLTTLPAAITTATASSAVGSYPITASGGSAANYTLSYLPGTLAVTAAPLTITANNQVKATGKANPTLTVSYSGFVNGDTPTSLSALPSVVTTAVTASPNGIYPITAGGAVDPNYTITYVPGTLTISAPTLAFGVPPTQTYGNPDFSPGATSNVAIAYTSANTAVATIVSGNIHIVGFGTATITASNGSTSLSQKLTVNRAPLTVTANNQSKVAGLVNPPLTVSYSGFVNAETAAVFTTQPIIKTTASTTSAAGTYPITVSSAAAANYAFTYIAGTLTVNAPTLAFNSIPTQVYGTADFNAGATSNLPITYTSSNQSVATIVAGNIHIIGVGVSTITASTIKGSLTQQLTVTPATLTVTAVSQAKLYGAALPALTVSYSGFVNGDAQSVITSQPAVTTAATTASPVGSYAITASGAAAARYTMVYIAGNLNVTPAPLTISANNQVRGVNKANPVLTASYFGFVNGDTTSVLTTLPTLSTTAVTSSPVGNYPITASGAAAANYTISYVAGTLSILTPTLTFNALPAETYGNADFGPGATSNLPITYTSSNPLVATIVNGNIHMLAFGSSSITATNGSLSVVQKLTVNRATVTITANNLTKVAGTANPTLTVSYSGFVNGDTQAVLTTQPLIKTTATTTSLAGTYPITVSSAAAANYLFTYVAGVLTVTAAPSTLLVTAPPLDIPRVAFVAVPEPEVKPAVSPNGDGIDDILKIENIAAYPDNKLIIINKGGAKVFEMAHYDNLNRAFDGHSSINGKMQQQGTYFYVLQYKDKDGTTKNTSGYIILKY